MKDGAAAGARGCARGAGARSRRSTPAAVEAALWRRCPSGSTLKPGKVYQPIRVAITGTTVSPGIFESLAALGREESLARIDAALARLRLPQQARPAPGFMPNLDKAASLHPNFGDGGG